MYCSMTGQAVSDSSQGIWDDGEWVSWDWINNQLYEQDMKNEYPAADLDAIDLFQRFVEVAMDHKAITGNYLQVWGELGELYAEIKFGIKRHRPMTQGSDGKIGNDFIEVKTISPEKNGHQVQVKRAGNFNKLLVIRIDQEFNFEGRMLNRSALGKSNGKLAKVSWDSIPQSI